MRAVSSLCGARAARAGARARAGDVVFVCGPREICDDAGALLVADAVQCDLGRTGWL